jgi:UDP-N-acetylmuramoyl-L-alanyl-D-glutamate--2,6-diaminopimelate ligase
MVMIGITGTNGKTTTAFLLESILKHAGFSVGLLSTIEYRFGSQIKSAMHTTPDPVNLQGILRDMHRQGTQYAVMEVSSHGIKQGRVENCHFDIGVFTNLTPEHLDYHGTMEDYAMSKERFFTELMPQSSKKNVAAVINQDDPAGKRFLEKICCRAITYGLESGDVHAGKHRLSLDGIKAQFVTPQGTIDISSKLVGTFNVYNLLAAVAASTALDMPPESIRAGIEKVRGIPGRMEQIENNKDILTFVDFAHTGDALENVLKTLRSIGAKTIITVFGCGGDRDRSKRPVMGRIAAIYSTVVIITSDNPRSENPDHIIQQIEGGIREQGFRKAEFGSDPQIREYVYFILPDRRTAIQKAVTMARPGDVVLIAGKGHETNQQKGNKTIDFDDREEAREALKMCA